MDDLIIFHFNMIYKLNHVEKQVKNTEKKIKIHRKYFESILYFVKLLRESGVNIPYAPLCNLEHKVLKDNILSFKQCHSPLDYLGEHLPLFHRCVECDLVEHELILELIHRSIFGDNWLGSNNIFEAIQEVELILEKISLDIAKLNQDLFKEQRLYITRIIAEQQANAILMKKKYQEFKNRIIDTI